MKTQYSHVLPSVSQEGHRKEAIKAVLDGKRQIEVAKIFGVTRQAVSKWVKIYREEGEKGLNAKRRGRPKGGLFLHWQVAHIVKTIVDRHPEELELPFYLWKREAVAQLIEQRFGIRLSIWTVGKYLARWGLTPQGPVGRGFEKNKEGVGRWLEEQYPVIQRQARREKAAIYWGDEMGIHAVYPKESSYGLCAQTPMIAGTGKHFACNVVSAVTNQGQLNFMVFKKSFCDDVFLEFLKRLVLQSRRKVFLIIEGHPAHCTEKIKTWGKEHVHHIRLFFFPSYDPELNLYGLMDQDVKRNAICRWQDRNQEELITNVCGHM